MKSARSASPRLLALLAGLLLCVGVSPAWAGDGSKLLPLLPAATQGVVVVNLEQARTSPLFGKLLGLLKREPKIAGLLRELEQTTGLKPERDLKTVVIASLPGQRTRLRGLVLVEGRFQRARLEKRLAADARLTRGTEPQLAVWKKRGEGPVFDLVFLRNDLIGFVHPTLLAAVVGMVRPGRTAPAKAAPATEMSGEFKALLSKADRRSTVWFAGLVPPEMRNNPQAGPLASAEGGYGGLRLGKELTGAATGLFVDEATAANLSSVLMLLRGRVALRPQVQALGLAPLLERLTAVPTGKEARIDLQVSGPELETIAEKTGAYFAGLGQKKAAAPAPAAPPPSRALLRGARLLGLHRLAAGTDGHVAVHLRHVLGRELAGVVRP